MTNNFPFKPILFCLKNMGNPESTKTIIEINIVNGNRMIKSINAKKKSIDSFKVKSNLFCLNNFL